MSSVSQIHTEYDGNPERQQSTSFTMGQVQEGHEVMSKLGLKSLQRSRGY